MSKGLRNTIIIMVSVLIIAGIVIYNVFNIKASKIPAGTVGAKAGNIYNKGLFCESDEKVYFSNSYDGGALYSMNADQTEIKKLYNLNVKYINAAANKVFFYGALMPSEGVGNLIGRPGMYMLNNNGTKLKALTNDVTQNMVLYGNEIYYEHYTESTATTLYKINIKSKKAEEVFPYMVNPSCCYEGIFYFNGIQNDHYLYSYNANTGEMYTVWEGNIWNPIREGDYVYYMDVHNNYRLCRYSLSKNEIEILTKDRVDTYNILDGKIFYAKSSKDAPALIRMNADGSGYEVMASGVYNDINMTSTYTYFKEFGDDFTIYCVPTYGTGSVREFSEAKDAFYKTIKK